MARFAFHFGFPPFFHVSDLRAERKKCEASDSRQGNAFVFQMVIKKTSPNL